MAEIQGLSAANMVACEPTMEAARIALSSYYGYDGFRPGQSQLIEAVLEGRDALGIMPTGAGKSLCYQIPGIVLPGLALVISPLVSLMKDQVNALIDAGVRGAFLNSTLTPGQQRTVMARAEAGTYKIMYVAPERLTDPVFREFASRVEIPLIAVDEAHCVSQWGQDFRPAYTGIADFIDSLPKRPPVIALTATATDKVRRDVSALLGLRSPECVVTGYDRTNLKFGVEKLGSKQKRVRIAQFIAAHPGDSGIVYCSTRKDVDGLSGWLAAEGLPVARYHAGMNKDERDDAQERFINDDAPIMVATNAFGMGIDKSNVRWVVHYNMPKSLEAYYQEAGRAGRDGEPSECLLLWCDGDVSTCRFFIEGENEYSQLDPEAAEIARAAQRRMLEAMVGYCHTTGCLRRYILNYFGDATPFENGTAECGNCSNCLGEFESIDVTAAARACVKCVRELGGAFGKTLVADIVRGSKSQRIYEGHFETFDSYGTVNDSNSLVKEVIELLASEGFLQVSEGKFPTVGLGERYAEALAEDFTFAMKQMKKPAAPKKDKRAAQVAAPATFGAGAVAAGAVAAGDDALFEELRALRKQLADAGNIAPYMVFSDRTLRDMCARRPKDALDFLEVNGVGSRKLERYGQAFLDAIAKFEAGE